MERICDSTGEWIAEHSRRLIEGDTVPCQVAGGLDRIPFELHASIILLAPLLLPLHPICRAVARRRLVRLTEVGPATSFPALNFRNADDPSEIPDTEHHFYGWPTF